MIPAEVSGQLEKAGRAVAAARKIADTVAASLKARATVNGKVDGDKLDESQWVSYDLAQSVAEITAAATMLDHARKVREGAKGDGILFEERIALLFAAEIFQAMRARTAPRIADFGIDPALFKETLDNGELQCWSSGQMSAANVAALGDVLREKSGDLGATLLSEDHELMRQNFRKFANEEVAPHAEHVHRHDEDIPDSILEQVKEMGCFGLTIPEMYGGLRPDDREDTVGMIVVTEELSRGSLGVAGSLITRPEILSRALLAGGTEEQKKHWLPKLASGDPLCAVAVTEPDFGSDVAAMKLPAVKVPGGWKLNGAKTWCTFGGKAGVLLVLARTNPDPKLGHKGLSVFLVEKPLFPGHEFEYRQPEGGLMKGKAIPTIGYRGMHSFEVYFEDYFVPDANLLGGEAGLGKGFYSIMAGFAGGRIQTAARAIGLMQAAYEKALTYASERVVFGNAIGNYQLTRVKIARMGMLLAVCRQFTYAVGRLMDEGKGQMEASLVKFFACKTAEWVTREAMQIHGGMGYAEETAVSRYWLDARVLSIFEGAEETLALKVIARALVDQAKA